MNDYSPEWFERFLRTIPNERTAEEVDFLARQLPLPRFPSVLDVPCGNGRHARGLAARGYRVLGIDRDRALLDEARRLAPGVAFAAHDMLHLEAIPGRFDAVLCLWQSFGQFDAATNRRVLARMAEKLAPGGRLVLDVYHRAFFEAHSGTCEVETPRGRVTETKAQGGGRLRVTLRYAETGAEDVFDWEVFLPEELVALGAGAGLRPVLACSGFDERAAPSAEVPRQQVVFENR